MLLEHFQTIEGPYNKHTIEDQGCSCAIRLKNCSGAVFFYYGMEQKKQKIKERKRKGDKDFGKCSLQNKV
jgi:hypothetical protein